MSRLFISLCNTVLVMLQVAKSSPTGRKLLLCKAQRSVVCARAIAGPIAMGIAGSMGTSILLRECLWEVITAKIGGLLCESLWTEGVLLVHTWWLCEKGGGAFTLRVLDIAGASDRDVVLLTERWCSSTRSSSSFLERGSSDGGVVLFILPHVVERGCTV